MASVVSSQGPECLAWVGVVVGLSHGHAARWLLQSQEMLQPRPTSSFQGEWSRTPQGGCDQEHLQ